MGTCEILLGIGAALVGLGVAAVLLVRVSRRLSRRAAIRAAIALGRASLHSETLRAVKARGEAELRRNSARFFYCMDCDLVVINAGGRCPRCGAVGVAEVDPMATRGEA